MQLEQNRNVLQSAGSPVKPKVSIYSKQQQTLPNDYKACHKYSKDPLNKPTMDVITTTNVQISTRSSFHDKANDETLAEQQKLQLALKQQLRKAQNKEK